MQQGIVDAYEVYHGVNGWSTTKPSSDDVVLNEAKRPTQPRPSLPRKPKQKTRTNCEGKTPRHREKQMRPVHRVKCIQPRREALAMHPPEGAQRDFGVGRHVVTWCTSGIGESAWAWYAVQVGAFRGTPEKGGLNKPVKTHLRAVPRRIGNWYAGVRQDMQASTSRKDELQEFDAFADAFVVRVRDGVRRW